MATSRQKKMAFSGVDSLKASGGGAATALAWEGLDLIPALKEKPMVAPLITLGLGLITGSFEVAKPFGYGMQGASSCELVAQLVTKIREGKGDNKSQDKSSISLNGQLNKALENPEFREKFQTMVKANPKFRDAVTRRLEEEKENTVCDDLKTANDQGNKLFTLALEAA